MGRKTRRASQFNESDHSTIVAQQIPWMQSYWLAGIQSRHVGMSRCNPLFYLTSVFSRILVSKEQNIALSVHPFPRLVMHLCENMYAKFTLAIIKICSFMLDSTQKIC